MESQIQTGSQVQSLALEALGEALRQAFQTMADLEVAVGPPLPENANIADGKVIAGIIGWVGHWSGTGVLECTPEFACVLTNLLLGSELTALDEDALNCIAEMANIVFGNMKTSLESTLGELRLGIPTVIYGNRVGMWTPRENFITLPVCIDRHLLRVKLHIVCEDDARDPTHYSRVNPQTPANHTFQTK